MSSLFQIAEFIDQNEVIEPKDKKYFDKLCANIICYPDAIEFNGRIKQLYLDNPYTTIINEARWNTQRKNKFEVYVTEHYNSPDGFNKWVLKKRTKSYNSKSVCVSFIHDPEFNLVFIPINNSYLECYAFESKMHRQVKLINNSKQSRFYQEIVNYLREIRHLKSIAAIRSDNKIIDALKYEINTGNHIHHGTVNLISNNAEDICYAYVPLDKIKYGECPSWHHFMEQFASETHEHLFMAWIYGLFVDTDFNRQVLWVEGDGYTGKSTVFSVLGNILSRFNTDLFKTITDEANFDKFSLEGFDNCRLAVFADPQEKKFFERRDILTMTGGDYVTINRKNKAVQSKRIMVKIAVYSNYPPIIDKGKAHEVTRLLHIKMDPKKRNIKKWNNDFPLGVGLEREFFFFLAECKQYYFELKGYDGLLKVKHG